MSAIGTRCPTCGPIQLPAKSFRLVVCDVVAWSYYSFICDRCGGAARYHASPDEIAVLKGAYVIAEPWHVPPEAAEPHHGPPLTYDDLLELALQLGVVDELVPLAETYRAPEGR
jgi:hypothetical protein